MKNHLQLPVASEARQRDFLDHFVTTHNALSTKIRKRLLHSHGHETPTPAIPLGPGGHRESGLCERWTQDDATVRFMKRLIGDCHVYQFHDTSVTSHLRGTAFVDDSRYLRADAGNLAAILYRLQSEDSEAYVDIVRNLQAVLPWLDEFVLEAQGPENKQVVPLRWRMTGHGDYDFVAGQLSDGSLRFIALITLLLLPSSMLPGIIIIDEFELGLHPAAEQVIVGLIKNASRECQIILSTQSSSFIDHFSAKDIVVVESESGETRFARQSDESLKRWLERYTLSQIWSKNVIGGRP